MPPNHSTNQPAKTVEREQRESLIAAYAIGGEGLVRKLDWEEVDTKAGARGYTWIHLNRASKKARDWLAGKSGIDPLVCEALLAEETRPRCTQFGNGLLINLRGVNLNPEACPEDMVSIRVWIEPGRIITTRRRRILAINDIREALESGHGPHRIDAFIADLADCMVSRMESVITDLDDMVDDLEEAILNQSNSDVRSRISDIRSQTISLRRYIAPQREAMSGLVSFQVDWIDQRHRARLREVADRVTRYVEDLDSARERASVIHEEMAMRLSEQMNKTMYLLSIVATIFLPLSLLTGLLGINVGGIPGAETPWAFWAVCLIMIALGLVEMWLFWRKNLF